MGRKGLQQGQEKPPDTPAGAQGEASPPLEPAHGMTLCLNSKRVRPIPSLGPCSRTLLQSVSAKIAPSGLWGVVAPDRRPGPNPVQGFLPHDRQRSLAAVRGRGIQVHDREEIDFDLTQNIGEKGSPMRRGGALAFYKVIGGLGAPGGVFMRHFFHCG